MIYLTSKPNRCSAPPAFNIGSSLTPPPPYLAPSPPFHLPAAGAVMGGGLSAVVINWALRAGGLGGGGGGGGHLIPNTQYLTKHPILSSPTIHVNVIILVWNCSFLWKIDHFSRLFSFIFEPMHFLWSQVFPCSIDGDLKITFQLIYCFRIMDPYFDICFESTNLI